MRFTIVVPSYLGAYQHAASKRDEKLIRAIDSSLKQKFKDFEVMVVADGCEKTFEMIEANYLKNKNVDCILIKKQPLWSGAPRNYGINKAKGEYIVYLDADDYIGVNHLQIISDELIEHNNPDWVWFNDHLKRRDGTHYERNILIKEKYQNGTSNICHKRSLAISWKGSAYGLDDWGVVQQLHRYTNNMKIRTPEYIVCHTQQGIDV